MGVNRIRVALSFESILLCQPRMQPCTYAHVLKDRCTEEGHHRHSAIESREASLIFFSNGAKANLIKLKLVEEILFTASFITDARRDKMAAERGECCCVLF